MTTFAVLTLVALAWLFVVIVTVAACRMAARSDANLTPAAQSPRRPRTWGTVRSRILRSPQSDQLATYK